MILFGNNLVFYTNKIIVNFRFEVSEYRILTVPHPSKNSVKISEAQKIYLKILLRFILTFARTPANLRNPFFTIGTQLFG